MGARIIEGVDWQNLSHEVIDYPGLEPGNDFNAHIAPHAAGPGTYASPSRSAQLIDGICEANLSLACADFAMPEGNPTIPLSLRIPVEGVMFYVADRTSPDHRSALARIVGAATSWTFFGILYDTDSLSANALSSQQVCRLAKGFVFSVYRGDSYLVATRVPPNRPGWARPPRWRRTPQSPQTPPPS